MKGQTYRAGIAGLDQEVEGTQEVEISYHLDRPQARGRGVGTVLVEAVLQKAREQGVRAFHVFSASRNTEDVLRFYRRHGFEPWGVQMYSVQADESRAESAGG